MAWPGRVWSHLHCSFCGGRIAGMALITTRSVVFVSCDWIADLPGAFVYSIAAGCSGYGVGIVIERRQQLAVASNKASSQYRQAQAHGWHWAAIAGQPLGNRQVTSRLR